MTELCHPRGAAAWRVAALSVLILTALIVEVWPASAQTVPGCGPVPIAVCAPASTTTSTTATTTTKAPPAAAPTTPEPAVTNVPPEDVLLPSLSDPQVPLESPTVSSSSSTTTSARSPINDREPGVDATRAAAAKRSSGRPVRRNILALIGIVAVVAYAGAAEARDRKTMGNLGS